MMLCMRIFTLNIAMNHSSGMTSYYHPASGLSYIVSWTPTSNYQLNPQEQLYRHVARQSNWWSRTQRKNILNIVYVRLPIQNNKLLQEENNICANELAEFPEAPLVWFSYLIFWSHFTEEWLRELMNHIKCFLIIHSNNPVQSPYNELFDEGSWERRRDYRNDFS